MPLIDRRIALLLVLFIALLAIALMRAGWLAAVDGPELGQAADYQQAQQIPVLAQRGTITDRNGVDLAVSQPAMSVAATPYLVKDPLTVAKRLAPLLGEPGPELLGKLSDRDAGFVYLARQVPLPRAERIQDMEIEGLQFTPETQRGYPLGRLASQTLGTVGVDGMGLSGLEAGHEEQLHGTDGERRLVNDALGKPISLQDLKHSDPGESIRLTLDARLQREAEDVLAGVGRQYSPLGATAIVMEPRSGDVLALANWPPMDAQDEAGADPRERINLGVEASYEPGSTFKAFTVAAALQDGAITPSSTFGLAPTIQVADREIGEAHARGFETMDVGTILAQSSNVGTVTIAQKLGATRFADWTKLFGFGRPTGVGLPGEAEGIAPTIQEYSGSSIGNIPIGQGLAASPIQMATAYSAIANGGILPGPSILKQVGGEPVERRAPRRIISPATAAQVREMLQGVVGPDGTAKELSIGGYDLAGKTGTADKIDPETGTYSTTKTVSSFIGFAPASRPGVVVAVMVDEPKGAQTAGADVAAPAWERLTRFALAYLRVPPE